MYVSTMIAAIVRSLVSVFEALLRIALLGRRFASLPGPLPLPFVGTRWIYARRYRIDKIHEAYEDMTRRYGDVFVEVGEDGQAVVSVVRREDIDRVLRYPSKYPFRQPSDVIRDYRLERPDKFASAGIAHEQGEVWRELRTKTTGELTSVETIANFVPELNSIGDDFLQLLRHHSNARHEVHDFWHLATRFALETNCTLVLGQRMTFMDYEVSATAQKLGDAMHHRFLAERDSRFAATLKSYRSTESYRRFLRNEDELYGIISEVVEKARNAKRACYENVKCILMSIVERTDLDEREKRSALIDFVAAGISTLSSSLTFALYFLAKNPLCQEKIAEEAERVAAASSDISASEVARLEYTKACMFEAFRLIPVAFALNRVLEEDTCFGKFLVPAGTTVLCHTRIACRNDDNFERALRFEPERWLRPRKHGAAVFAPFGRGKRMCPGKRLMETTIALTLAKVVRNHIIRLDGDLDVNFEFILSPKMPVVFKFEERR